MYAVLSDSGEWVLVFQNDDKPPEEMLLEEFIALYGEDAVPKRSTSKSISKDEAVECYYRSFRSLCKTCGEYAWAVKTEVNNADGIFPVQKVVRETFGGNADAKLAGEVHRRDRRRRYCVDELDDLSRQLGFKPMSARDKEILLSHLHDATFRKRLVYRIDKYSKTNVPLSARDLVIEVLKTFQV